MTGRQAFNCRHTSWSGHLVGPLGAIKLSRLTHMPAMAPVASHPHGVVAGFVLSEEEIRQTAVVGASWELVGLGPRVDRQQGVIVPRYDAGAPAPLPVLQGGCNGSGFRTRLFINGRVKRGVAGKVVGFLAEVCRRPTGSRRAWLFVDADDAQRPCSRWT